MKKLTHIKSLMKSDTGEDNTDLMDRRTVMKGVGAFSAAAAVAGAASTAMTSPASAAPSGKSIILDVDTDGFADFQQLELRRNSFTGPFYVSGDILAPGDSVMIGIDVIGTFHCWGWIRSPDFLAVVNQEFDIDGRGKILISGVESDAPRAVSGGTGDFANAQGEGIPDVAIFDFLASGQFRIAFSLTSADGPPII